MTTDSRWRFLALAALCATALPARAETKLEGEISLATASWDACDGAKPHGHYFLGRFSHNLAVVEVSSGNSPTLAKLWARAKPGGTSVSWPGGRVGVRHLDAKNFAQATPLAGAGRLFVWEAQNGWGTLAPIVGVELAKSLCDANALVVYVVLKFDQPGEGFTVASLTPPAAGDPAPVSAEPSKPVMGKLYEEILARLQAGLRAQKLAPAQIAISILPGHFSGDALEYAVSLKWQNGFDDRFSLVCLADETGAIKQVVDKQEGGAGGMATDVADLADGNTQDLIYQLTTLDGSAAALWSLAGGKLTVLVQTTPVGE